DTPQYRELWTKLRAGEAQIVNEKRIARNNRVLWVQATYYPILDRNGRAYKVVKHTCDVTEQMLKQSDGIGQLAAISKAQGVLELDMDGTIRTANQNFLSLTGYALDDLRGRHHRMLVDPAYAASAEY